MLGRDAARQPRRQRPLAAPADEHGAHDLLARIAAAVGDGVRHARQGAGRSGARVVLGLRAAVVGAQGVRADADADDCQGHEEHAERHRAILAAA
jgi:hypothetical protein